MSKSIRRSILLICLFAFSTSISAQQFIPKYQTSPDESLNSTPQSSQARQDEGIEIEKFQGVSAKPPVDSKDPLIQFQTQYPDAQIVLHNLTSLPHIISNIQSEPYSAPTVQIARRFLRAHGDLLLPDGDVADLELIEILQSQGAEHVHFQQVYRGVPIFLGVITVHVRDQRVVMYTASYHPSTLFRDLSLQPAFSESQAMATARGQLNGVAPVWLRAEPEANLVIYPAESDAYHLAYHLKLPAGSPLGDWEFLIDAQTGDTLQQTNLLMHVDGEGTVYEENPITTRTPVDRVLPNLDGSSFLRGDFADILVYDGPAGVRSNSRDFFELLVNNASSDEHDFRFNTNDSRFDEANVYFHINRIHDYFKDNFDFTGRDASLPVIVGHPAVDDRTGRILDRPMNNAFFSPFTQGLAIGSGSGRASGGLNNLARDADVLYHEYTHAVINRIVRLGIRQHDTGRAMGEAYADYFPTSFFDDPDMGEWAVSSSRGMRNLDNDNRFPDDLFHPGLGSPEEHFTGLIWGGACWSLRERIGARDADQIIFNSLFFLPRDGSANFQTGLTALLEADKSIFDGLHQEEIRQVLNDRGICEQTGCPVISGVPTRNRISSTEFLGVNQYTIEVPNDATSLQVDLRALDTSLDIDLHVRFGRPVTAQTQFVSQPRVFDDHQSVGARGTESVTITPNSQPSLRAGTYFVAIVNWTEQPRLIDYDLTASVIRAEPQDILLNPNISQSGSIGPGAAPDSGFWALADQYRIEIGPEIEQFDVTVTPDNPEQDIDFALRLDQRVGLNNSGRPLADVAEEKPTGGGTITLTRPELRDGTYFIAVGNYDQQPANFVIEVRLTEENRFQTLNSGLPVSGSSEPGNPPLDVLWDLRGQHEITVPQDATSLTVKLEGENPALDLDLAVRFDEPIQILDGRLVADFREESPDGIEVLLIDSDAAKVLTPIGRPGEKDSTIPGGTYYIAIGSVAAQPANWTLTATVSQVQVDLTPTVATVETGEQQQFTPAVSGTENPTVIWSVNGIRGGDATTGTIDSTGLYTAPITVPNDNPVTVRAVSLIDQTQSASALVTIIPPPMRDVDLASGIAVEGEIGPGINTPRETIWQLNQQYRIAVPEDARELIVAVVAVDGEADLNLAVRFNQRVLLEEREIVGDFIDQRPDSGGTIRISPPELQAGIYFIALGNFSLRPATFTLTGMVVTEPQLLRVSQDGTGDFATISEAISVAATHATIEILDGGIYKENILIEQDQITLKAASGGTPTIDGDGLPVIVIDTVKDATISGLRIINGTPGIFVRNGATCLIDENSVSQSGDGIRLENGAQATIQNSEVFNNTKTGIRALDSIVTLINNEIFGNGSEGLDGGILIADAMERALIRNNLIDRNANHGLQVFGSQVDCINSQITRNGADGIWLSSGLADPNLPSQAVVINSTIVGNKRGIFLKPPGVGSPTPEASVVNTIIAGNEVDLANVRLEQIQHSLIGDGTFAGENHNIGGAPMFVDSTAGDYQLRIDSPAIDAGTKVEGRLEVDLAGNSRLFDGNGDGDAEIDLGAYEFQGGQPTAIELIPATATVEVNHTQAFRATVIDTIDQRVRWQIRGATSGENRLGTITSDGIYTAPATIPDPNAVTIEAISLRDTSIAATLIVTIVPEVQTPIVLISGVPVQGEVLAGNPDQRVVQWTLENQYQIFLPKDAVELIVQLEGIDPSQDVDLAVRYSQPLEIRNRRLTADFRAESPTASEMIQVDLITDPPVQSGVYFIAVGNFDSEAAEFTLTATVGLGRRPGVPIVLQSGEEISGTIAGASPPDFQLWDVDRQYQIEVPSDATRLTITLITTDASMDVNLAARFNQRSTIEDGNFIADIKSRNRDGEEQLRLGQNTNPPLQAGTYYITIGNFEARPVDFTLRAIVSTEEVFPPWDVNQDGITDLFDLVAVGGQLGLTILTNPRTDINDDGVVNILDLVEVSNHFGEQSVPEIAASAVSHSSALARVWLEPYSLGTPDMLGVRLKVNVSGGEIYGGEFSLVSRSESAGIVDIRRGGGVSSSQQVYWYTSTDGARFTHLGNAQGIGTSAELALITLRSEDLQNSGLSLDHARFVDVLGRQIPVSIEVGKVSAEAMRIPKKSVLLPNYPNPFNPETWIPYQLAEPARVLLTIYDTGGALIRELDLGHRQAGSYISRNRAAYWDGRTQYGERVASGVYFYRLEAGSFSAIAKMVVVQ